MTVSDKHTSARLVTLPELEAPELQLILPRVIQMNVVIK